MITDTTANERVPENYNCAQQVVTVIIEANERKHTNETYTNDILNDRLFRNRSFNKDSTLSLEAPLQYDIIFFLLANEAADIAEALMSHDHK